MILYPVISKVILSDNFKKISIGDAHVSIGDAHVPCIRSIDYKCNSL